MLSACQCSCGKNIIIGFLETEFCKHICTKDVYNIILIEKGCLVLQINGQKIKSFAPCIWLLKENLDVKFVSSQKLSAKRIYFDVAFLYRSVNFDTINSGQYEALLDILNLVPIEVFYKHSNIFSYVLPISSTEYIQINNFFMNFYNAILNQSYSRWSCLARQNLNGILEMLHQIYVDFIDSNKQKFNKNDPQAWVQALLKIIHTNYSDGAQLSLVPLSKKVGINKDTVSKKFKEIVGCSVGEYIINYRIKCACHSLANTEGTLKEIADQCGFGNETYFIRQFKKRKGMTPAQFRKNELKLRQAQFSFNNE